MLLDVVIGLVVIATASITNEDAATMSTWSCVTLTNITLASGVWWTQHNCTGVVPGPKPNDVGPMLINIAHANLGKGTSGAPVVRPAVARTPLGLAKLHDLAINASSENRGFTPLAGINGGYFFEVGMACTDCPCTCTAKSALNVHVYAHMHSYTHASHPLPRLSFSHISIRNASVISNTRTHTHTHTHTHMHAHNHTCR